MNMAISGVTSRASLISLYNFNQSTASLNKSVERLSSGLRINRSAEESVVFARMQVLTQTGAFALIQANAISATVLTLFQGGS